MDLRSKRHRVLRIILSITLAIVIAAFPICQTLVVAEALALTSAMLTVAAVFLGAMGITFATNEALQKGAGTFFEKASAEVKSFITTAAATADNIYSQVLSVPASIFSKARKDAVVAFPPTKTEVEDISGIGVPSWQAYVSKPFSAIPNFSNDHSSYGHLPIPILINSIPTGSPYAGDTIIPISPSAVVPLNTVVPRATHNFSVVSSTQVCRIVGVSGTTYDFRAHVALTSSGVVTSLSVNNNYLSSIRNSYDGLAQIKDLMVSFGWKSNLVADFSIPCLSVRFDYLKGELWEAGGNRYYGYAPSMQLHDTKFSPASVFGGYVDGRTGAVSIPTVGYIPDQSICNDKVLPGAINDALTKNPDLVIDLSIPATQQDLINAKWQDIIATQQDFIDLLNERIAALENAGGGAGTGEGTITGSVEIEIGEIAMPNMKPPLEIKTLFPFCIPFDVMRAMECFVAEPVAPRFVIPLKYSNVIDEEIVLDFEMFDFIIEIVRWGELMIFTVMLAAATRNYIKW